MMYAPLVGLSAAVLYQTYNMLLAEPVPVDTVGEEEIDEKHKKIQEVLDALKEDLAQQFPNGAEVDPATKLMTKDFLLKFQLMKQEYKRLVCEVIPDANSNQRIGLLKKKTQREQALAEAEGDDADEGKKQIEGLQRKYEMTILLEKKELDQAEVDIHEIMMDYFNLIT